METTLNRHRIEWENGIVVLKEQTEYLQSVDVWNIAMPTHPCMLRSL